MHLSQAGVSFLDPTIRARIAFAKQLMICAVAVLVWDTLTNLGTEWKCVWRVSSA